MNKFDCTIIGAGMVGGAIAVALADLGLKVVLIDKFAPEPFAAEQAFDIRVSAISLASQHLLEQLGAWSTIASWRVAPYRRLAVWENEASYTEFNAESIGQQHLGHIIENRLIQLALWQLAQQHPNITLLCPEQLQGIEQLDDEVLVTLSERSFSAKLLCACDGANSQVRELVNIGLTGWDYQQSAMLVNVKTEYEQQDITWQQYLPTGPVAMLPMPGQYASLVWYHQRDEIKRLQVLPNKQLAEQMMAVFPKRLGGIEVLDKGGFPLTRRHANQYFKGNVVLLGDAAHTINPMAGQGVNLGFKDVKALQSVVAEAIADGKSWHSKSVLQRYEKKRRADNLLMMSGMDALYKGFSQPSPIIKGLRNIALAGINKVPLVKNKVLAYACGVE